MNIADDVWFEVCLRLPLTEIFKCKCVSKVWLSILSDPYFINKWYKLNSSLWTLILGLAKQNPTAPLNSELPLFHPELNSQFISHHQSVSGFSLRFLNQKHELSNTKLYVVGSSNGLVLCTNAFYRQNNYYVCNPLSKKWVSLPPPPTEATIVHTGFTCESSLISTSFKVIRVDEGATLKIDIFSSDLGKWNVYNVLHPGGALHGCSVYDHYVTHNGVFYWMKKGFNQILAFSVNRNHNHQTCGNECRLISLPDQEMDNDRRYFRQSTERNKRFFGQCLGESEGLICYAIVKHKERSLSVWVLEENWSLLHKDIKFYDILAEIASSLIGVESTVDLITDIQVIGFNPVDKNVVIISYKTHILAYNIRNGGYEQLSHPSILDSNLPGSYVGILTFALKPRPTILPAVSW
ncbi:F-box protein At5g07610-like [Papaver somniferum]|uniref:F-box protein At5g07610-like n=1 Tax=Papaver somniferum TaxID=3469 RepID=UPI000E6FBF25|nr:F-box protein At5g07610-like [Papaver somniferum]